MDPTILAALIGTAATIIVAVGAAFFGVYRWRVEKRKLDLEIAQLEATLKSPLENPTNFLDIRRGLFLIAKKLSQRGFWPDVIVSFTRSGAAMGAMLAPNIRIAHVVSISRVARDIGSGTTIAKRTYTLGELINLNQEMWKNRKILVTFMLMDTGNTLEEGIKFLEREAGIDEMRNLEVATLYITSGARNRWPNAIFAYDTADRNVLRKLPWIYDEYDFV